MVESATDFGIGFLSAALLGLLMAPLVFKRLLRRSVRRMVAAAPYPPAELRADREQLRTKLSTSTRQLEVSLTAMKTKTMSKLAELEQKTETINQLRTEVGDKTDAIARLRSEIDDKASTIATLESRNTMLAERLRVTEKQFDIRGDRLCETEQVLADREAKLTKLAVELGQHSLIADQQREEIAALREQVDAIRVNIVDYENALNERVTQLFDDDADTDAPWRLSAGEGEPDRLDWRRRRS
jgi:chromosome segregation ATPase